jgi:hypothetical protein
MRYCRRASRRRPSCTSIFKRVWYPMPLRPAISRALATSGAGNRSAICTLVVRLRPATRVDPFFFWRVLPEDWCLRNSRPSTLSHQVASSSSLLNIGTFATCFSFFTPSLSSCTPQEVIALLPRIQVVCRDHSNPLIPFRQHDGKETVAFCLTVIHISRLAFSVLLVYQDRFARQAPALPQLP